jgi:RNA 2',3'-cyclic 3'-phosphodiesterase
VRLFVALYPPAGAVAHLREHLPVPARGSLTEAGKWHITLAFLGEVAQERLPELITALGTVTVPRGRLLRLAGGGDFGRRVTWAGVEGDMTDLADLAADVRRASALNDPRPFTPHLTVMYSTDPAVTAALATYRGEPWPIEEIALVHSADRAYTTVATW